MRTVRGSNRQAVACCNRKLTVIQLESMPGLTVGTSLTIKHPKSAACPEPDVTAATSICPYGLADAHRGIIPPHISAMIRGDCLFDGDDCGARFRSIEAIYRVGSCRNVVYVTAHQSNWQSGECIIPVRSTLGTAP